MSKKSPRRTPRRETPTVDHICRALIAHIDGGTDARVLPSVTLARTILAAIDAEDPDLMHGEAGFFATVVSKIHDEYREKSENAKHVQLLSQIRSYGADDLTVNDSAVAFDIVVQLVTLSATTGAALMYELLRGAR